jgi:VIT1/CCC1 family predicted Fe2+/Mn2+ transporter
MTSGDEVVETLGSAAEIPAPPVGEHHHRDLSGGLARAAVFGASDGLVSNVSLILGVAAADPGSGFVRLAGLAGLIAGAVSMAAGEYGSMKAQQELFERELELERIELRRNPHVEQVELSQLYQSRGLDPDMAREMAARMMSTPERALETHAREELGIDPEALGSPVGAAVSSFVFFSIGALLPLLPWFFIDGQEAMVASVVLGLLGAASVGFALAYFTDGSKLRLSSRYVIIAACSAAVTFAIGSAVGIGTG